MFKKIKYLFLQFSALMLNSSSLKISFYVSKNIFRSREKNITPPLKFKRYSCLRIFFTELRVTDALYTLHRCESVIMLIYEKVKETTAHLPSDRPI